MSPRLRSRLLVSISRILHAPGGRILSYRLKVRALLSLGVGRRGAALDSMVANVRFGSIADMSSAPA